MSYSSANTITTVATREIQILTKSKGIMVTMAITLILIIAGVFVASHFANRDAEPDRVAVVGVPADAFADSGYDPVEADDRAEAETMVRDGDAEAALVRTDTGWDLLADGTAPTGLTMAANAIASSASMTEALVAHEVDPQSFFADAPTATINEVNISEDASRDSSDDNYWANLVVAFIGISLLMFALVLFAANIGSRVTAEKSSRVVELLLASVRTLDFLAGKIIGNIIFGTIATSIIFGVGALALSISGLLDGITFSWGLIPILIVSFLLGMFFFGSLYAAAGAMVQRTEDLQTTQGPVMVLIFITLYIPIFGWTNPDATWMQIASWIPPFSIATVPIQYAVGNMNALEIAGSYALMAVLTLGAMWLAARIYRNSILNNGKKMGWVEALRTQPV